MQWLTRSPDTREIPSSSLGIVIFQQTYAKLQFLSPLFRVFLTSIQGALARIVAPFPIAHLSVLVLHHDVAGRPLDARCDHRTRRGTERWDRPEWRGGLRRRLTRWHGLERPRGRGGLEGPVRRHDGQIRQHVLDLFLGVLERLGVVQYRSVDSLGRSQNGHLHEMARPSRRRTRGRCRRPPACCRRSVLPPR